MPWAQPSGPHGVGSSSSWHEDNATLGASWTRLSGAENNTIRMEFIIEEAASPHPNVFKEACLFVCLFVCKPLMSFSRNSLESAAFCRSLTMCYMHTTFGFGGVPRSFSAFLVLIVLTTMRLQRR